MFMFISLYLPPEARERKPRALSWFWRSRFCARECGGGEGKRKGKGKGKDKAKEIKRYISGLDNGKERKGKCPPLALGFSYRL